jgi:hypothetical protein
MGRAIAGRDATHPAGEARLSHSMRAEARAQIRKEESSFCEQKEAKKL